MSSFIIRKKRRRFLFYSSLQTFLLLIACHILSDRNVLRVHSLVRIDLMEDLKLDFLSLGNARASVSLTFIRFRRMCLFIIHTI